MVENPGITNKLLLAEVIDHLPHYIFWKDVNLVFRGCNKKFYEQFGYTSMDELIGKTDEDFPWSSSEIKAKYNRDDLMIIETGKSLLGYEEMQQQPDGSFRTLLVSKVPLHDSEGEISGVLGIYTDITKQKVQEWRLQNALDEIKKLDKTKSEFIANMSHDLRTPLSGIIGLSEILEQEAKERKTKQYLQDIFNAAKGLMKITDEILEISSSELDLMHYQEAQFSIREMMKEIVEVSKPVADLKGVQFSYEFSDDLPKEFYGRSLYIQRIVLNLVSNAIKFTDEGGVYISVSYKPEDVSHGDLLIEVKDTGVGIPKDMQAEIFEPFKRLTPSYEGTYSGVGLGLYLVKTFLDRIDGEITINSAENEGTVFLIKVPIKALSTVEETGFEAKDLADSFPDKMKKKKILLVEDNEMAIKIAVNNIQKYNCDVDVARCSAEAIEMSMMNRYDLIFMDIGLPDKDGVYTSSQILQFSVQNSATPICALTAHANHEVIKSCLDAGVDEVLRKPLTDEMIRQVLAKL